MDKKALRALISEKKRAMTLEQIQTASDRLARLLYETELYQKAAVIYGYLPYNQEVRTVPILKRALADGKKVAVPKVYGDQMRFIYLTDLSRVAPGYAGIPEPVDDEPVAEVPDALVLMPGLAFDREGNRMGYGGGYYDRLLASEPEHPTVALCYEFQMVTSIPCQSHDVPVDLVLWA